VLLVLVLAHVLHRFTSISKVRGTVA
jgi:hypothetical protein